MKPNRPATGKDPLENLLLEWRVETNLPPRFEEQVWRRIAIEEARQLETGGWHRFRSVLEMLFLRPAFAGACVFALVLTGLAAGWWQGNREVARLDDSLGQRYVQSVAPFAESHH